MTEAERKLAKLSKTMNNAPMVTRFNNEIDEKAYLSTIKDLQASIKSEKNQISNLKNNYNMSVQAKLNEDSLKDLAKKHHFQVLESQIREKQLKKQIFNESELTTSPFYQFRPEVPQEKNYQLKEDLISQIKQKQEMKKLEIAKDLEFSKRVIENSNKNLEDEYNLRAHIKENAYKNLIDSWEENKKLKEMQKKLEKFILYGPKPEPQPPYPQHYTEENDIYENEPIVTEEKPKKRNHKSVDKAFNWKSTLRTGSVKTNESQISGKSFNGVIEKFSKLTSQEKKIRKDKHDILEYFKKKNKFISEVPRLPQIAK